MGPACRSQLFKEYLVQRIALGAMLASRLAASQRRLVERLVVDGHRDQSDSFSLFAGQRIAEQEIVLRLGHPAQQRPDDRGMVAGGDAELGVPIDDARLLRGDRNVGEQAAYEPGPDRRATMALTTGLEQFMTL